MSLIFDSGLHLFFSFSGLKQSEAESCYINIARTLDFYGVELHSGRVCLHCNISLGFFFIHLFVDIFIAVQTVAFFGGEEYKGKEMVKVIRNMNCLCS